MVLVCTGINASCGVKRQHQAAVMFLEVFLAQNEGVDSVISFGGRVHPVDSRSVFLIIFDYFCMSLKFTVIIPASDPKQCVWGGIPKADMYVEEQGGAKKEERQWGKNKGQIR